MGRKKSIHCGTCPSCNTESVHVKEYGSRHLKHFTIGEGGSKLFHYVALRCTNEACKVSCFRHYPPVEGIAEVSPRSRYTKSSKNFVGLKLSCQHVSFHGLKQAIVQDFDAHTSISSLHRWTQAIEVSDVSVPEEVKVLHTDEKHPSKKKQKCNKKFIIATAGRVARAAKSRALHANLADSNSKECIETHYKELIDNGLDASKVDLVVTDMLPAYNEVIAKLFPNAKHQYCTFHFIQKFNSLFKDTLTAHRQEKFAVGDRKEAHKISFLLLKGQEKLTKDEQNIVTEFGKKHPTMLAAYALKEDIRHLYANAKSVAEAYACKDMLEETYRKAITPTMEKALDWFNAHFDKTVSYLEKGYMLDRTNNDAERMMRTIKRTQQTHYFLRKEANYIKKVKVVLGIQNPIAA